MIVMSRKPQVPLCDTSDVMETQVGVRNTILSNSFVFHLMGSLNVERMLSNVPKICQCLNLLGSVHSFKISEHS